MVLHCVIYQYVQQSNGLSGFFVYIQRVWGDAAIGLGVTAAIAVVCLVLGVVVALKKRQEQKSKTGQLQMSEGANYNSNGIGGNQADVYANSMVYEIGIPASSSVRKPEWLHSI